MTSKRSNSHKKQIYGTPLPLPCLQEPSLNQQLDQQQRQQKQQQLKDQVAVTQPSWSPLDTPFELFKRFYSLCKVTRYPQLNLIQTEFHPQGQSVWVKRNKDMETLFRQGFFGKGTLSRSEATWKQRHTTGAQEGLSLEEITRQRRIERAQLKKGKASQILQEKGTAAFSSASSSTSPSITSSASTLVLLSSKPGLGSQAGSSTPSRVVVQVNAVTNTLSSQGEGRIGEPEENYEHLQLSLEEAFFLVFAVECISVTKTTEVSTATLDMVQPLTEAGKKVVSRCPIPAMSIQECWLRFSEASTLQPRQRTQYHHPSRSPTSPGFEITASNPFVVRYVVYHYYRSQGWIVKDGLKYGSDFLLYKKGMVFGHSQYVVKVVPCENGPDEDTVILCFVVLPKNPTMRQLSHPRTALPLYTVAEVGIKRFIPEKNRV
ncbi:tRNA splicing endonuclease subunit sen2 [Modicella reniformis]|uniref:tRNA-splicing endonuclease subunit Sen2 n=1 Tax=Modicella reniformis TaxID=1440133 RepID=A0A9P6M1Z3_9FUNG|nr:tRNA splicing endonuclease subunit sen2 [Modicella reniformis]